MREDTNKPSERMKGIDSGTSTEKVFAKFHVLFITIKDKVNAKQCYGSTIGNNCVFRKEQENEIM